MLTTVRESSTILQNHQETGIDAARKKFCLFYIYAFHLTCVDGRLWSSASSCMPLGRQAVGLQASSWKTGVIRGLCVYLWQLLPYTEMIDERFLPERLHASVVYSYCPVSVRVCPSVISPYCIKTAGRNELVFAGGPSSTILHWVKKRLSPKIDCFPWNFVPNSELRKFRSSKSTV